MHARLIIIASHQQESERDIVMCMHGIMKSLLAFSMWMHASWLDTRERLNCDDPLRLLPQEEKQNSLWALVYVLIFAFLCLNYRPAAHYIVRVASWRDNWLYERSVFTVRLLIRCILFTRPCIWELCCWAETLFLPRDLLYQQRIMTAIIQELENRADDIHRQPG